MALVITPSVLLHLENQRHYGDTVFKSGVTLSRLSIYHMCFRQEISCLTFTRCTIFVSSSYTVAFTVLYMQSYLPEVSHTAVTSVWAAKSRNKKNSPALLINAIKRLLSLRHMIPPKRFSISPWSRVLRLFRCVRTFLKHLYYELYGIFISLS